MRLATLFQQDPSYPLLFHLPEAANEGFCFDPDGLIIGQNNINFHLHRFKNKKKIKIFKGNCFSAIHFLLNVSEYK